MNIIFMGTPDFSLPVLEGLAKSDKHDVKAVVTQPDKARGRSGKLTATPVKEYAIEQGIDVYTPVRVKDAEFVEVLKNIPCDVMVVIAFGQILSQEILDIPRFGCVNVHASLLPRWRGAAPMQWAILSGDAKTGITTMQMDAGLDTGDMLLKREIDIEPDETDESLHDKLSHMGSDLLLETLDEIESGAIKPEKQNDESSTYASMLTKELGKIYFSWEAVKIERYMRGLSSWPGAYCDFRGKTLKLYSAEVITEDSEYEPGTICDVTKKSFSVQTGKGVLKLKEVQLEGKKRMDAASFLNGNHLNAGERMDTL
ncbi:MAG: methionyl-tRNA formyltransferase [Eubacterium sp.]|nr:methionyl-tRNA formyltransferase [Eubacterium sp.]